MRTRLILISWAAGMLFAANAVAAAPSLSTLSSSQAGVTVKVTPRTVPGGSWEFELTFDTHSGELTDDLQKTATLVTDRGARLSPAQWQGDPAGGHHRKGVLRFEAVSPAPKTIELQVRRAGESAPRSFRWQLE